MISAGWEGGEDDEATGFVREAGSRDACRGFPY